MTQKARKISQVARMGNPSGNVFRWLSRFRLEPVLKSVQTTERIFHKRSVRVNRSARQERSVMLPRRSVKRRHLVKITERIPPALIDKASEGDYR